MIVCRDAQWREAAIVLSCMADGAAPLVIIDPPPVSEEIYRAQHDAYRPARARLQALSGRVLAPWEQREDRLRLARLEVDRLTAAMSPFRYWWRQQRTVATLLPDLGCNRALVLFTPAPGDLDPIEAFSDGPPGKARFPILPATVTQHVLVTPLDGLADAAWQLLRGSEPSPDVLTVEGDEPQAWLEAFAAALAAGRRLRPGPRQSILRPKADGREAVLVEAMPSAAAIMGVQYAHRRQARLAVVPPIDVGPVRRAIDAVAELVDRNGPDMDACLAGAIAGVDACVSVPERAVAEIGDLPLTAFTAGTPYAFMRRHGADWATKPIGHLVGNPTVQVLSEQAARHPGLDFIFDPELIGGAETSMIEATVRAAGRSAITVSGLSTLPTTLMMLTAAPTDLLYFNTHGSDTSIKLGFEELETPGFKLIRGSLANAPIVFNNSCQSWTGVGREFLLMGARGYLGTLWSVEQGAAAAFAEALLRRAWEHEQPIAVAMHDPAAPSGIGRAYMFMGTVDGRLAASAADAAPRDSIARLRSIMGLIEHVTVQPGPAPEADAAIHATLVNEKTRLAGVVDAELSEAERFEFLVAETRIVCLAVARRSPERLALAESRSADCLAALGESSLPLKVRLEHEHRLLRTLGEAQLAANAFEAAIDTLGRVVSAAGQLGVSACDAHLLSCDAWRRLGCPDDAAAAARAAWREAAHDPTPLAARLLAVGRLAQLENENRRFKRSLRYALWGQRLARQAQRPDEQAVFKGDETRALMSLGRWPEALEAATAFLALARHPALFGTDAELSAHGRLGQCLTRLGRLADAREKVETGLLAAHDQGRAGSTADFLVDRAHLRGADRAGAVTDLTQAAETFAALRRTSRLWQVLGERTDILNRMHADRDPAFQAAALGAVAACPAMLPSAPEEVRGAMVRDLADRLLLLRPLSGAAFAALDAPAEAAGASMRTAVAGGDRALGACLALAETLLRIARAVSLGMPELAELLARKTDAALGTSGMLLDFCKAALSTKAA